MPQKKPDIDEARRSADSYLRQRRLGLQPIPDIPAIDQMRRVEGLASEPGLTMRGGYNASERDPNDKYDARNPGVKPYRGATDSELELEERARRAGSPMGGQLSGSAARQPKWRQHMKKKSSAIASPYDTSKPYGQASDRNYRQAFDQEMSRSGDRKAAFTAAKKAGDQTKR